MVKTLNDIEWKEIPVARLFEISGSKTTPKSTLEQIGNGKYPYVTTQTTTNGQAGYYNVSTEKGGVLTVDSAVAGFCTYQANDFSASDHVEILTPKFSMNKYIALFLTVQINQNNQKKFSYGYKACQDRLREMSIMLPVNSKDEPDYKFMEDYIKERETKLKNQYKNYIKNTVNELQQKINEKKSWKDFELADIFNIKSGKRLTKLDMVPGSIPFVSAAAENNGVTNFIANKNDSMDKNVLGVNYDGNGGMVISFYHPYKTIFSDSVKRFHLKNITDNKYILLFCKISILMQRDKYRYGYKFNETRMKRQKIMLPVNSKGEPDYQYMEDYMKYLEQKKLLKYLDYIK